MHYFSVQFALWTVMLIFSCPTFSFPNHYGFYSKHASFPQPQHVSSPYAWNYFKVAKPLRCFLRSGANSRKPGSYFQQMKTAQREKHSSANEFVLVERRETKTEINLLLRVSSAVSRALCAERRSKLSANKNDLNTDFPQHLHTHTNP